MLFKFNKQTRSRVWHKIVVVVVFAWPGLLRKRILELKSLFVQITTKVLQSLLAVSKAVFLYTASWSTARLGHSSANRSFGFYTLIRACWQISNPRFFILFKFAHCFIRLMLHFYCQHTCYLENHYREKSLSWNHDGLLFLIWNLD
jgi:hypothetical protein